MKKAGMMTRHEAKHAMQDERVPAHMRHSASSLSEAVQGMHPQVSLA